MQSNSQKEGLTSGIHASPLVQGQQRKSPPILGPKYQCTSGHRCPEKATGLLPLQATLDYPLLLQLAARLHLQLHCLFWISYWSLVKIQTFAGL